MLTAICIILIVAAIFSFSIISEARVSLNLYGSGNSLCFFLFGIKIIKIDITLMKTEDEFYKLQLKNKDKVIATLGLNEIDKNSASDTLRQAMPNPFYNLDIVTVDVDAEYGGESAFRTTLISLALTNFFYAALLYLVSTQRVKTTALVRPNFNTRTAIFNLSSIFSITIADIIYGIIFGKKGEKKNDIGK